MVAVAALGLATGCVELGTLDPTQVEVVQFASCGEVESHVKSEAIAELPRITSAAESDAVYSPYGYVEYQGVAATDAPESDIDHAITNNQERGVAEADIFQVDATHAFALHDRRLVIIGALGPDGAPPRLAPDTTDSGGILQSGAIDDAQIVADVPLDGDPIEMFLAGDTVIVIQTVTQHQLDTLYESVSTRPARTHGGEVVEAVVFDVTDRSAPGLERRVAVEGDYVAARRIGGRLHLVARAGLGGPQLLAPSADEDFDSWAQSASQRIEGADLDAWLPYAYSTRFDDGAAQAAQARRVDCNAVYTARTASGDDALGIYSFDVHDADSEIETTTFVGDGTLVYASLESLVVAHTNYATTRFGDGDTEDIQATALHRFAFTDEGTRYTASGIVHGWILNAFGISEHDGYLRAVTQINRGSTTGLKPINVFTLSVEPKAADGVLQEARARALEETGEVPEDDELDIPESARRYMTLEGELVDISHGEDLYAVRFKGDKAFVITWAEVRGDPLWTIDLANPWTPKILGRLDVPGFTTYLHPIDSGRILGVGRGRDGDAVKLSLFGVSQLTDPEALHEIEVGGADATSEAGDEHRAFRWIPERQLMALPIDRFGQSEMVLYHVDSGSLSEVASIADGAQMRRAYHIGDYLYALSERGVSIVDMDSGMGGVEARVTF